MQRVRHWMSSFSAFWILVFPTTDQIHSVSHGAVYVCHWFFCATSTHCTWKFTFCSIWWSVVFCFVFIEAHCARYILPNWTLLPLHHIYRNPFVLLCHTCESKSHSKDFKPLANREIKWSYTKHLVMTQLSYKRVIFIGHFKRNYRFHQWSNHTNLLLF